MGRFISIDNNYLGEKEQVNTQNRYIYTLNNPYKYVDRDEASTKPSDKEVRNSLNKVIPNWEKLDKKVFDGLVYTVYAHRSKEWKSVAIKLWKNEHIKPTPQPAPTPTPTTSSKPRLAPQTTSGVDLVKKPNKNNNKSNNPKAEIKCPIPHGLLSGPKNNLKQDYTPIKVTDYSLGFKKVVKSIGDVFSVIGIIGGVCVLAGVQLSGLTAIVSAWISIVGGVGSLTSGYAISGEITYDLYRTTTPVQMTGAMWAQTTYRYQNYKLTFKIKGKTLVNNFKEVGEWWYASKSF